MLDISFGAVVFLVVDVLLGGVYGLVFCSDCLARTPATSFPIWLPLSTLSLGVLFVVGGLVIGRVGVSNVPWVQELRALAPVYHSISNIFADVVCRNFFFSFLRIKFIFVRTSTYVNKYSFINVR